MTSLDSNTLPATSEGVAAPVVLITGGSRGLGRSMALALAAQGMDVVFTYRSQQAQAEGVVQQIEAMGRRALAIELELGQGQGMTARFAAFADTVREALARRWQVARIDALVNNAGIGVHASVADTTEEQFDLLFNLHLKGVFFLTQALLPLLSDGGRILNLSSGPSSLAR